MTYLIGVDIGTSGTKAVLCDQHGHLLTSATAEYPLHTPHPLWNEQHPEDWWNATKQVLHEVITTAGVAANQIAGLGLTGQMHGSVFLDVEGNVIRPALLWNDQRTAAECREIAERVGPERLIQITGNPALTGFQAPKLLWLRNHEPANYATVRHVLLPKDFIRLRLTGVAATDASDAAGTLLLDLATRTYSPEVLQALDIPAEWLPRVYEGPDVTGALLPGVATELGLPAGLPIIAGGGDNAAAAIGTGVVEAGLISSSIGTSGVIFAHSDTIAIDPQGRLHAFCHSVPNAYHLMAVTLAAGGAFRWLRDALRPVAANLGYAELTTLANSVPIGAEGLLFLPYLNGERTPHLDPFARGGFIGLTARHTVAHMARAVMEGVVFAMRDGLEIMRELGVPINDIRATGGGASSPLWLELQANIYGVTVSTLATEAGASYGAALLAGVGVGVFPTIRAAVAQCVKVTSSTPPNPEAVARYNQIYPIYGELYGALRSSMHRLAEQSAG
jgi:xylulokinase